MDKIHFNHRVPLQIRFNDIDALGHLNNSVYFCFFDLGKATYFQCVRPELIDWDKIDLVIANINADFLAPVFRHEEIAVETTVCRIGNKSIQMLQRILETQTGAVKCTCTTTLVGFDKETYQTLPISESWREAISLYENRSY